MVERWRNSPHSYNSKRNLPIRIQSVQIFSSVSNMCQCSSQEDEKENSWRSISHLENRTVGSIENTLSFHWILQSCMSCRSRGEIYCRNGVTTGFIFLTDQFQFLVNLIYILFMCHVFTGPLPALLIMLFITLRYDLNYLLSQRSLLRFVEIFFGNVKRFLAKEEKNKGAIMTSLHSCSAITRSDNINIWSENPNKFFKIYFLRQYYVPSRINAYQGTLSLRDYGRT